MYQSEATVITDNTRYVIGDTWEMIASLLRVFTILYIKPRYTRPGNSSYSLSSSPTLNPSPNPCIHLSFPIKKSRTNTLPRPSARLHDPGHVRSRVQDVIVEVARVERRPLVRALGTSAPLEDAVRHRERGPVVRLHGVLGIREVAVLQAHVRRAPRVVPVAGYAAEVVVVQVRVLQVVGARVPLVRPVEPVVVDRALRCDVVRPAYVGFWC